MLGAGLTRVRVREFAVAIAVHTIVAALTFILFDKVPGQTAPNTLVMLLCSLVAVYSTYTTERREREALLVDHQLALANAATRKSGVIFSLRVRSLYLLHG